MSISTDGIEDGGPPGPDTVGSPQIIDDSVESVDIQDGTITVADLAFNPFVTGPRTPLVISLSATVSPLTNDLILLDTTVTSVVASLPLAPIDGESVEVKWFRGAMSASVSGNGKLIEGSASLPIPDLGHSFNLTYVLSIDEWVITT